MTKEKATDKGSMVTMRYSKAMLAKIDQFMRDVEKHNPGLKVSRADAIRMLVSKGLEKGEALV